MNVNMREQVSQIVNELFSDGKTALSHFGIDAATIRRVEMENPHVAKLYPWPQQIKQVA